MANGYMDPKVLQKELQQTEKRDSVKEFSQKGLQTLM